MKSKILFVIIIFALIRGLSFASGPAKITIEEKSYSKSGKILLGDIAKIETDDQQMKEKIAKVFIALPLRAGQHVVLTKHSLSQKILRKGIKSAEFSLNVPEKMCVYSNVMLVLKGDILREARKYADQQNRWTPTMKLAGNSMAQNLQVPAGPITYQCKFTQENEDRKSLQIAVDIIVNNKVMASETVCFKEFASPQPAKKAEEKEEKNPETQNITPGEKVRKGDPLTIKFLRKNLAITLQGKAAESGVSGNRIRVLVNGQDKTYNALLQNGNTAIVEL